mgnify:CR=1 FL=1
MSTNHPTSTPPIGNAAAPAVRAPLLSLDEALARLTLAVQPFGAAQMQHVSTFDALGRVLAEPVRSVVDVPPADNTSMDGYVMRCADVPAAGTTLPVSQRIPAGVAGAPLVPGTAARIFTGGQVPAGADAVLHFAGVNRGTEEEVKDGNPAIARRLADACARMGVKPHVVYANSTHARLETLYGVSKRRAADILGGIGGGLTNLILPHIFGEGARPRYNNVTATFIEAVIAEGATTINVPDTVGYAVPELYGQFIKTLRERIPNSDKAIWSVHCHNDLGMAVANSLAGVKIGGARQVECTINGLGERAGNCSLEEVVMALRTRADVLNYSNGVDSTMLMRASRLVNQLW